MTRILGLDLGTNSLGWAVVEQENDKEFTLVTKGVRIFQEGVKIDKGKENSKSAERTEFRSARRNKYRRRLRKIETLKVLSDNGYCPKLSREELINWRYKKVYPANAGFRNWWLTDDNGENHPYAYRNLAVTVKLDLGNEESRYKLGRAFYHIAQRRGFISNRLESTKESEGKVQQQIAEISQEKGNLTLGQYFYEKYRTGEKIRDTYTHRTEHYLEEFNRICEFQALPEKMQKELYKAIFSQRPLRSQKGSIGKCVFETKKQRCSVSRPEYEEYRMLCFVNNIKIKTPTDEKLRPLNKEERAKVIPRFFLKREHFDFEDLAKALAPKKQYKYYKDRNINPEDFLLNFNNKTTVSGCPVSARFVEIFADSFIDDEFALLRDEKFQVPKLVSDTWHALFTFDSTEKLSEFAHKHLRIDDDQKEQLLRMRLKSDYASLSLKAINKIVPFLRKGLIYSHAVFLANLEEVLPKEIWQDPENKKVVEKEVLEIIDNYQENKTVMDVVNSYITNAKRNSEVWSDEAKEYYFKEIENSLKESFGQNRFAKMSEVKREQLIGSVRSLLQKQMSKNFGRGQYIPLKRIDESIKDFLKDNFGAINIDKLYHPSATETYKPAQKASDGKFYLGSPMTSSVRNPMAMRALHQLRKVVNELIKEGVVDGDTKINIEMSRGLLNANERAGLKKWQESREKLDKEYINKIRGCFTSDYEPSEDEILKYQLWEEQGHLCIYSGDEIAICEFLGDNPSYDIEHTIPRSLSYDNSQVNKTLCQNRFNRSVKKNKIPHELSNHSEIMTRIDHWRVKSENLDKEIEKYVRIARGAADKSQKDQAIQKRHELSFERDYWRSKYNRFTMKDVPSGFKNSQIVDIGIITKYSRLYLKTIFDKVYTVKGNTVADFRRLWGIQNNYSKKERKNHIHHCIDAITIACMSKNNYENLAKFYHDSENAFLLRDEGRPFVQKPWKTFTEDIHNIENEVLVSHHTPDHLPKQSKKKLRIRNLIQYTSDGKPIYLQGDTVRGSLHKETFYGAIERELTDKNSGKPEKQIKYVVRKPLNDLDDSGITNIVDDRVKDIVLEARQKEKVIQREIDTLVIQRKHAEEKEEAEIDEKISELRKRITELYCLPNRSGNPIPIKKVRVYQPMVTNPLHLKPQRDRSRKSRKEYKEKYHVVNDGNYLMAIYEGRDAKGKIRRDFRLIDNLTAGKYFKLSAKRNGKNQGNTSLQDIVSPVLSNGNIDLQHRDTIKTGSLVLFWNHSPEELKDLPTEELAKRLYKVTKFAKNGQTTFKYHQESRNDEQLKADFEREHKEKAPKSLTNGESKVNFQNPHPKLLLSPLNFNFLVGGKGFNQSVLGKIELHL